MPDNLEGPALDLLKDKNFATFSTLRPDGTVQSVVVWTDADDGGRVVLNSAEGRAWPENLRRTGHATVTVINRENPMEYVAVTGELEVDTTEDGEASSTRCPTSTWARTIRGWATTPASPSG